MSDMNNNVPILRFAEFFDSGDWEEKTLGDIFERITEKNKEDNKNVLTISAQHGLISQLEYFNKSVSAKNLTGYYLLNKGDFAYNKSYSNGYPIGAIKKLNKYDKGVVSTLYICFRLKNKFSKFGNFFEQYFESGLQHSEIEKIAQEGARNHGLLNIGLNDFFKNVNLLVPSIEEQQKIADCLSSLDEQINSESEQLTTLESHKKGLMQQLFPTQNKNIPACRFPEFKDSGEWEEKKLKTLAKKSTKKNKDEAIKKVFTNSATYGIIDQQEYFDKSIANKSNLSGYFIIEKNDFVYNPRCSISAPVGPISKNKMGQGVMSPLYTVFRFNQEYDGFYEQYFKTSHWHDYLKSVSNTGARHDRMSISSDTFMSMPLPFPTLPEQQKIANCLASFDDLITTQREKIDVIKLHKKGLMQGLFPTGVKK